MQAWDFGAGSDWGHVMHNAMSTAERVVIVLSPDYLRSAHGEAEWRHFYAQDPTGERGLMLPVRIYQVDPPGLLRTRVYADLVGLGAASARAALLTAARKSRGKPSVEPEFPGLPQQAGMENQLAPQFPGQSPHAEAHAGRPGSREPGSSRFSDLVYALGRAIANPATIFHISERAGLNCGDLESGSLTATERWHAALKLAEESRLEEELCHEAVRASANRKLHAAVAAYLSQPSERLELELSDLRELIRTLGRVSPDPRTVGRLRSYLDSAAAQGITALNAISGAIAGRSWLPPLPAIS